MAFLPSSWLMSRDRGRATRGFVVSLWLRIIGDGADGWAEVLVVVRCPKKPPRTRFKQFFLDRKGGKRVKVSAEIWSKVRYLEHTAVITLHATCVD